ncbi:MAG: GNAT family N-acetyltransferase [Ruminococcus sp.]|nr:GNAT family N-acetyltransferase [Ruminococcus sp.]
MEYRIRLLRKDEFGELDNFLYEAIFVPEGVSPPTREILFQPELQVYVRDFGTRRGDVAFAAESGGKVVGAAWSRIMNDYGHINDDTPSLAISLYKEYRGIGIGTELMRALLGELKSVGFGQVSLSVQKANRAVRLYRKIGFVTIDENDEEYIMLCRL